MTMRYVIAPDGYIPNSVVRQSFNDQLLQVADQEEAKWRLNRDYLSTTGLRPESDRPSTVSSRRSSLESSDESGARQRQRRKLKWATEATDNGYASASSDDTTPGLLVTVSRSDGAAGVRPPTERKEALETEVKASTGRVASIDQRLSPSNEADIAVNHVTTAQVDQHLMASSLSPSSSFNSLRSKPIDEYSPTSTSHVPTTGGDLASNIKKVLDSSQLVDSNGWHDSLPLVTENSMDVHDSVKHVTERSEDNDQMDQYEQGDRSNPVDSVLNTPDGDNDDDDNSSELVNQAQVAETENTVTNTPRAIVGLLFDQYASQSYYSSGTLENFAPDGIPVVTETKSCQFGLLRIPQSELDNNVRDQSWSTDHHVTANHHGNHNLTGRPNKVSFKHRPGAIDDVIKVQHSSKESIQIHRQAKSDDDDVTTTNNDDVNSLDSVAGNPGRIIVFYGNTKTREKHTVRKNRTTSLLPDNPAMYRMYKRRDELLNNFTPSCG